MRTAPNEIRQPGLLTGHVNGNTGVITKGGGFVTRRLGTGVYELRVPGRTILAAVATASAGANWNATTSIAGDLITLWIWNASGGSADFDFDVLITTL